MTKNKRFYTTRHHHESGAYEMVHDKSERFSFPRATRDSDLFLHCMNTLAEENDQLKSDVCVWKANAKDYRKIVKWLNEENGQLKKENKELKHHIKKLEKELHLVHMGAMFSTVKSFNGDVSKRYYYSEKTDRIYDTANNYGQYDKILDKKEVAMLLNEYETLLNRGDM